MYYRNKGFSKRQLEIMEHEKKVIDNCVRVMTERSHGDGGCNALNGGYCPPIKKKKRCSKPVEVAVISPTPTPTPTPTPPATEEIKSRIASISQSLKEEWDDEDDAEDGNDE